MSIDCVIFDLGGVLIDWDPRRLYRKMFDDEPAMECFLEQVCNRDWIMRLDAGEPFEQAAAELAARHPEHSEPIYAFRERWTEMVAGAIDGTVAILRELRGRRVPLYALSNFSADNFPHAQRSFEFLAWFDDIVISAEIGVNKPDARIYRHLIERQDLVPARAVFIDDLPANVAAARAVGLQALQFTTPAALRSDLARLGLLG